MARKPTVKPVALAHGPRRFNNRIPFAEAIAEPLLFKAAWASLSLPQQVILRATYGLELRERELEFWAAFNGRGVHDDLGYLESVRGDFEYRAGQESQDITLILGRRFAKTYISSFVMAYEALCGDHRAHIDNKEQDPIFLQVAQDLDTAKANLRQVITHWLKMSPIGARELDKGTQTAESIKLSTGLIKVGAPTIKLRGQAIAVCAMDELAFWPKDVDAANPDVEIENAVRPAMAQFPFRKLMKTSTPWTEVGLLWDAYNKGTYGYKIEDAEKRHESGRVLVLQAPTAMSENPAAPEAYLRQERAQNVNAYSREYLAQFAKSVSGFLSPLLLRQAVTRRVLQREPKPGVLYIATMDPAFRRDAFTFAICHLDGGRYVLDYIDSVRGTREAPISPSLRLAQIAQVCKVYGVRTVTSDQYHDATLAELALDHNITIDPYYLTPKSKWQVWGDFSSMLNQQKVELLDNAELLGELLAMERHLTPQGTVQIEGRRDDMATVVALGCHKALQYGERAPVVAKKRETLSETLEKSVTERSTERPWWAA